LLGKNLRQNIISESYEFYIRRKKDMKKKIVGIFVCTIFIAYTLPAMGYISDHLIENEFLIGNIEIRPEFIINEENNPHYLYDNQVYISASPG